MDRLLSSNSDKLDGPGIEPESPPSQESIAVTTGLHLGTTSSFSTPGAASDSPPPVRSTRARSVIELHRTALLRLEGVTALVVLAGGALVFACGALTPVPRTGPHTQADSPVEVRTLPPEPVRVEVVPPRTSPDAVWIDGRWEWAGRRWFWRQGCWQVPPPGAYYAAPAIVRIPVPVYLPGDAGDPKALEGYGMTLMYLPGHWHLDDGGILPLETADGGADGNG